VLNPRGCLVSEGYRHEAAHARRMCAAGCYRHSKRQYFCRLWYRKQRLRRNFRFVRKARLLRLLGTLDIDVTGGSVTGWDITFPGLPDFNSITSQGASAGSD